MPSIVQADLIPGRGDQLLTWDLDTGLQWLNLTVTANRSYLDILAGFGGFIGIFGFQFATSVEVGTLFMHAGITRFAGPSGPVDPLNYIGIELIQDLMNGKVISPGHVFSFGMVKAQGGGIPSPLTPLVVHNTWLSHASPDFSYTDSGAVFNRAGNRSPTIGSYLVKRRISSVRPVVASKSKRLRKGK